ncbi:MAG: ATP phosphoribosyltransferase regulatory subunit [Deltaproteobacteria bacterium]|nr:ATP phosphoribosyltransferase regulatory subunit [Deltaproteobacteria bacterium]
MTTPPFISLPHGVRDILPEEARIIGAVESGILSVFERHGFKKVITPLLEYVDVLSIGMGENLKDRVLKFIDPSTGRVVAIRPDITPQIARLVATRMKDYPLPLKLSYNGNVIRYHEPRDGRKREVLQIGAEHITEAPAPEADAEMIVTAIESLSSIGLKGFKIDIGDVGFLRAILEGLGLTEAERGMVKDAIARKDSSGLDEIFGLLGKKIGRDAKKTLLELVSFYGTEEVFEKASAFSKGAAGASLENLRRVFEIITVRGFKDYVTIDLGEVRGFDYYTGIIFEGFAAGVGKPILSGGRYDSLFEKYGCGWAATGFAFDVENIALALGRAGL